MYQDFRSNSPSVDREGPEAEGRTRPTRTGGRLVGKAALVTGASRGIGRAIATRLVEEGAEVAITFREAEQEADELVDALRDQGGRAFAFRADVGNPEQVRDVVDKAAHSLGRLDVLVNNAGMLASGRVEEVSLDLFDRAFAVNVRGAFVAIQAVLAYMPRGGRIINIGSIGSDYMPFGGQAVYSMTKGALASLTRGLARDLGERGITVNNVQPGRIRTDLLSDVNAASLADFANATALHRLGAADEVAAMVAYLASGEAGFVTGANLRIDGGTSI
jgi:3-oxoacyl-[acyl-carrier protein] reductase